MGVLQKREDGGGSFWQAIGEKEELRTKGGGGGFDKYAETDDEDYDDVFGKPNGGGAHALNFQVVVRFEC